MRQHHLHHNTGPPDRKPSKTVQMRFQPSTVDRVNDLKEWTGIDNRTQIVASSIEIVHEIFAAMLEGQRLYLEKEDGELEELTVVGFKPHLTS